MEHGARVAADCIPCPGGYHCPDLGTVTPQTCGAGKFSVSSNNFILASVQCKKRLILVGRGAKGYIPQRRRWNEAVFLHYESGYLRILHTVL